MSYELKTNITTENWPPQEIPKDPEPLQKDSMFYLDHVTILVENALFKVPKYPFEQGSEVFRDMFQLPIAEGSLVDGCDDSHPLRLDQIKKEDFIQFLKVLFQGPYKQEILPASAVEWTSVLKLSTMWDFEVIRQAVIQRMSIMPIECVEKAVLAMEYKVDSWLIPALNELAQRAESITVAEMGRLGPELTLKMAAVREGVRERKGPVKRSKGSDHCRNCGSAFVQDFDNSSNFELGERCIVNLDFSSKIQKILTRNM
ncbi:hypothetical protein SERLA73DRAFT_116892 [Serpula lacrymans var. lacrymans S7.3]|uniref:BTB domain-containing protein n=2 Tax=Serpula lacrymans var. lacrymans TaxID=341189 RepID=F8QG24_SERL3|nr:uncharacterized protein SERLADRAFT_436246 [Serpula lacrymans var. lacrymans S7.9]EGN92772.1 hypothetical protein SERLA73DRAFT_116892 [Serpula lacrymans var. lacrymans S7.3]EGO26433.1 hypothetical protein SERLADRAFT_436246 [Serpula lacrymans var. lacrymans S7.9]